MKVLHSYKVYRPDVDGGVPFVIAILSQMAGDGIDNEVLVARLKGPSRTLEIEGLRVTAVASFGTVFSTPLAPTFPFVLAKRARHADVVVHHSPFPLADLVLSHLPADVALIVYWHADIIGYPLLKFPFRAAIRKTLQRADRIIVADKATVSNSEWLPSVKHKCSVVPFGADIDFWSTCTALEAERAVSLRRQYPRLIVAIGRLVPYKGFDVLIKAMAAIDGHLVIIGEGPLLDELDNLSSRLGVADHVSLVGRVETSEVKAYLHAARAFAFPSVTAAEAFGIVQLEAMAASLPIVNTSLPTAVPGIARHDQESLTVPPRDPEQLAAALNRVLDEPGLAERLGASALRRVRENYTQQQYLARVKDIYRDVLENRRKA